MMHGHVQKKEAEIGAIGSVFNSPSQRLFGAVICSLLPLAAIRFFYTSPVLSQSRWKTTIPPKSKLITMETGCMTATDMATEMLQTWVVKATPFLKKLQSQSVQVKNATFNNESTAFDTLKRMGVAMPGDYCYAKYTWVEFERQFQLMDDFLNHCNINLPFAVISRLRGELYANFITKVARNMPESANWKRFSFVIDLSDGTRNNRPLREAFGVPVLAFGAGSNDNQAILIPDPHMMMGVALHTDYEDTIPRRLMQFANGVHKLYIPDSHQIPWADKISAAVYRGTCYPSINPDVPDPNDRISVRAKLCELYNRESVSTTLGETTNATSSLIDVGLKIGDIFAPCYDPTNRDKPWYPSCQQCQKCANNRNLDQDQMKMYKYQIVLDGNGPAYDGTVWKFLSNSTVFWGMPDDKQTMLFQVFYFPLLQEQVHYFPSKLANLKTRIQWCLDNDDACRTIAGSGQFAMSCILRVEVLKEYFATLLKVLVNVSTNNTVVW